ncbi:MAG: HD domain-containing phosphohydrolase [FCB group bacterium]|jgi:HD-GYP domain-containing protein (c-di-GMP phosphodiesterase class II)|nr:HD domain-containing phosphohydrolase [FCB group bacterium]
MLKQIAVVNQKEMLDALSRAAGERGLEVVSLAPSQPLPPTVSAVVAAPADAAAALDAAVMLADRNERLLLLLARAVDCREEFRPDSSRRVLEHAVRFADAIGLSTVEKLTFERAALVRDIGKLDIPNDILLKDAILTYDEWELIRNHPAHGAALLTSLDLLVDTADIVKYHHENFDGSGYPEGLEGKAIPLAARAMRILDTYCAMTSRRRYREGVSTSEDALKHLREESGTRFDPKLVRIFIESGIAKESE